MAEFLGPDWLEEVRASCADLPGLDGVEGRVQYVITGGPGGKVQFHVEVADGRVEVVGEGKHAEPDCTVTLSHSDALAMLAGDLSPDVGFMTGQVKVEGDHRVWLLGLRPLRLSPEGVAAREKLWAATST